MLCVICCRLRSTAPPLAARNQDSGAETPATRAANPNKSAEHVRNTASATQASVCS